MRASPSKVLMRLLIVLLGREGDALPGETRQVVRETPRSVVT